MCWYQIRLKKILQWASWDVDLIFRIVCQISGQDNVSCQIQNSYWHFQIKSFYFCVSIVAKGYCRNICFNEGFICNRNFSNCAAKRKFN